MQVSEVMTRNVEVISPDTTLQEAARKMKDLDVGPLPVCDGTRLQGMVTDRDITIRGTAEGFDPRTTKVTEVMTPDVVYCLEDQDVSDAVRIMEQQQIRRLVVLDRDKNLVGIVSLGDVAVDGANQGLAGEVLTQISEPAQPQR